MTILITEEEIKNIKENPIAMTISDILEKVPKPLRLKSGYYVIYSIQDARPMGRLMGLLSIYRESGPDPADCEHIAKAIFGPGYKLLGLITNAYRFYKIIEE